MSNKRNGKVISFINMKGGVGKTTLTKEISYYLSLVKQKKVLVVDIDPQANLTQSFFKIYNKLTSEDTGEINKLKKELEKLPSINNLFIKNAHSRPERKDVIMELSETLYMIPGNLSSIFFGRSPSGEAEQILHNFIKREKLRNDFDYIIIDCPPTYSFYTTSALLSSDYYLVPVRPDAYSALGLDLLEEVVSKTKESYLDNFEIKPLTNLGVIFTMTQENAGIKRVMTDIQTSKYFLEKNIYFFEETFLNSDKIPTRKLDYLIYNSQDTKLISNLESIVDEFERRLNSLNGTE